MYADGVAWPTLQDLRRRNAWLKYVVWPLKRPMNWPAKSDRRPPLEEISLLFWESICEFGPTNLLHSAPRKATSAFFSSLLSLSGLIFESSAGFGPPP
jgi:hypothetical protein